MSQSKVIYTGLPGSAIFGAKGTLRRGCRADTFLIYLNTGQHELYDGDLTFYETSGETFTLTDCVADTSFMKEPHNPDGHWFVVARVRDRRQRWMNQHFQCEFNARNPAGEVEEWSKKTCKEVVEVLLEAMEESSTDTEAVSASFYPYVKCSGPPCLALEQVLARCGYDLVLKADDSIEIVQIGNGSDWTDTSGYIDPPSGVVVPVPDTISLHGGPTIWQTLLDLEPVGEDLDGDIVAIDSLSYAPAGGFAGEIPQLYLNVDVGLRWWAFRTVHRWFRVSSINGGGFTPTDASEAGTTVDQLLPLLCHQAESGDHQTYLKHPASPIFGGQWWPYTDHPYNTGEYREYSGHFRVDCRDGIVKTEQPVIKLSSGCPVEADMYLLVAHRFRKDNKEYDRWTRELSVGGSGPAVEIYFPELFKSVQQNYDYTGSISGTTTNTTAIEAEADAILSSWQTALSNAYYHRKRYGIGIRRVECDGIISAVEWSAGIGRAGHTCVHVGTKENLVDRAAKFVQTDDAPLENALKGDCVS